MMIQLSIKAQIKGLIEDLQNAPFLRRLVGLIVVITAIIPTTCYSYSFTDNRTLFPMGETEAFMANAGVALSGSTGSAYFNPAGLATLKKNHISLSGDTYLSSRTTYSPIETIDSTDLNLTSSGFQAVPSSLVSTWSLGPWVAAFAVMVPHQVKIQDIASFTTPNYSSLQIARTDSYQLIMAGPSLAAQFDNGMDLGIGCFYTRYQTTQQLSWNGIPTTGSGLASPLIIDSYFDAHVDGLMCDAGIQGQYSSDLRIGAAVHLPFIAFGKAATAYQFVQAPQGANAANGPTSVTTDYQLPLDGSVGFEYRLSDPWRAYFDVSYQLSSNYSTGEIGASANDSKAVARFNLGSAFKWNDTIRLFGGLAYNPSAVNINSSNGAEDFTVGTVGVSVVNGVSNIGLGLMYAQSSGSAINEVADASIHSLGNKTSSLATQVFGLMINSSIVF